MNTGASAHPGRRTVQHREWVRMGVGSKSRNTNPPHATSGNGRENLENYGNG